ncbi:MAG: thiamine pyrophosphate-dependent enzyme [bacterium]|nr:thiamine pyrophosphate-dependent enzyme [bacterium]
MAVRLKDLAKKPEGLASGHRGCAGCMEPIAVRQILLAIDNPCVVCCTTGCLEVVTTIFPFTAWKVPFIHSAFESAAATISGVETAYKVLKKRGKIKDRGTKFIAIGGDGGTYDIGFQALSGAIERGHDIVYICLDNEAYMNTGIQRSSATPMGAHTTTSPAGKVIPGKREFRKDLTRCIASHNIPYVAQAVPSKWRDLITKVKKAVEVKGPAFINILSPCRLGWGYPPEDTIEIGNEAVETCFWPIYEVEDGKWRLTYKPKEKKPVSEWLKKQGRFKHLFKPGNESILEEIQDHIDQEWERLQRLCS